MLPGLFVVMLKSGDMLPGVVMLSGDMLPGVVMLSGDVTWIVCGNVEIR